MGNSTVVYDACVLYPAPLRDLLIQLALSNLFRAKWTAEIHDEWIDNLLQNRPDLTRTQLERTRDLMNQAVLDCLVTDYGPLISTIVLPDEHDRHVVAAAIKCHAQAIVTCNLQDFPNDVLAVYGMEVIHPDDFIMRQIGLSNAAVCTAAKIHRARLKNPPKSVDEYLSSLEAQGLPQTAGALRNFAELI